MKLITKAFLLTLMMTTASCGGDKEEEINKKSIQALAEAKNIEDLKKVKIIVSSDYETLRSQLNQINASLEKLDTVKKAFNVTAVMVKDTLFKHFIEFQGNVQTKQNVVITSEYGGKIRKIYVKSGESVRKNQLLAKIEDGGLNEQVLRLQSQSDLSQTTFQRQEKLWNQKIGSEIAFLQAKTEAESSVNAYEQARAQLGKTLIKAPFKGTIDNIITEEGTNATIGTAIFRIVNLDNMYVEVQIPEKFITSIKVGTKAMVFMPILNKSIESKVRQVSNFINPNNRSFTIEVAIPNLKGMIKPNLTAKVSINDYTSESAKLIPQSIISKNGKGEEYIYLAELRSGKTYAKKRIIKTSKSQEGITEVIEGLEVGDQLIIEGARSIKENQLINIQ
jgi:RND family efflux transporter MFP subunit